VEAALEKHLLRRVEDPFLDFADLVARRAARAPGAARRQPALDRRRHLNPLFTLP
jgi:hypothetical protein